MGDFNVRRIEGADDRSRMYQHAIRDIETFEQMLQENLFDSDDIKIGAEQELCIVQNNFDPAISALEILDAIDEEHYTNELALFNLEINLDPELLTESCFARMESELQHLLKLGYQRAQERDEKLVLAGILPTLKFRHLQFEYMTPIQRYKTLSESLSELRGSEFEVCIQGVDDLIMTLGSVLFEACNTSFQLHLQIDPKEFVNKHNWAQMIAGPVLSCCVNSPMLFGNELWAETRISLFKQSLDTRSPYKYLRRKVPRVYFGNRWLKNSPADLWKDDLMRFPLVVTSDGFKDSHQQLINGEIPDLRAIQLHNGTTYTWNRMCYGGTKPKPHLRIECRYLPSGPSVIDEIANFVFWIGLMSAEPPNGPKFWEQLDFKEAKSNFIRAAKSGLNSIHNWFGHYYPSKILINDVLLPMARTGLENKGVHEEDISKYLGIIERRVNKEVTGAQWIVKSHRNLTRSYSSDLANRIITESMCAYQADNIPVSEWKIKKDKKYSFPKANLKIEEFMSTDIFSVNEDDSTDLAKQILTWNNIHHLPVEDSEGDLVGLITDGILERHYAQRSSVLARDIMIQQPVVVHADDPLSTALRIMEENMISGVPVVFDKKLVGILTNRDI